MTSENPGDVEATPIRARNLPWAVVAVLLLVGLTVTAAFGLLQGQDGTDSPGVSPAIDPPTSSRPFLRGMTVTCPRAGQIWGTEDMRLALRELDTLGVDWVAIHPYAGIQRDGSIRHRPAKLVGYLDRAVRIAGDEQFQLFWKPHLAYWGSFEWRGEISFGEDEAAWKRFFDDYRAFIVDQAAFAETHGISLFAVGVELEATTHREKEWRKIVQEVRRVYSGRITYAANWDRLSRVSFWDAVDVIGVQAYFPLSDEQSPSLETLSLGWNRHLDQLEEFSRSLGKKPVLFTEIGYNSASNAAREPWSYRVEDNPENRELRRRLIETALTKLEGRAFLEGVFWWKWMPGKSAGRSNFSMRDPEMKRALREAWASES
ncbi:MAG: hypothetical protein K0U98_21770 [Deltaproteobacteria bacterium]|nr:hypothetical protein [Deltaproteobacteria bacterium]